MMSGQISLEKQISLVDPASGRFTNRRPSLMKEMSSFGNTLKMLKAFLFSQEQRTPPKPLPEIKPDLEQFLQNDGRQLKYIWLGHSSFLVNFEGRSHPLLKSDGDADQAFTASRAR